jgi:hypothetical protein
MSSPSVTDGTANLGPCDSLEAVTATGSISYACWGSAATDFKALRKAYTLGGMVAVRRASTNQQRTGAVAAASGGTQLTGYANVRGSATYWTYFGTIHYGTIDSRGNLTEYGQVFVRDVITLTGNFAGFKYSFQRVVGHGSDVAVQLRNYFTNIGWYGGSYLCPRTAFLAGHTATCNHSTYILGYAGTGFYSHSQTTWWNAMSPNPSSADGSWTVTEPHGPMDCARARAQQCMFR